MYIHRSPNEESLLCVADLSFGSSVKVDVATPRDIWDAHVSIPGLSSHADADTKQIMTTRFPRMTVFIIRFYRLTAGSVYSLESNVRLFDFSFVKLCACFCWRYKGLADVRRRRHTTTRASCHSFMFQIKDKAFFYILYTFILAVFLFSLVLNREG